MIQMLKFFLVWFLMLSTVCSLSKAENITEKCVDDIHDCQRIFNPRYLEYGTYLERLVYLYQKDLISQKEYIEEQRYLEGLIQATPIFIIKHK